MREEFLHFIWQYQYFKKANLTTTNGDVITVIHPGFPNRDAGPDFSLARIKIKDIEWHGQVEIHYQSSEWNQHKHQKDQAYDNVILHVVWKNDKPLRRLDNTLMPTLELKDRIDLKLIAQFELLLKNSYRIPCETQFKSVTDIVRLSMMDKALTARLQKKAEEVKLLLVNNNNDWEQTAYQLLARNFGFKLNSDAFLKLSERLPLKILQKHANQRYQLEALLYGQAGLLEQYFEEEYPLLLKKEYDFLSKKYGLQASKLEAVEWKFSKTRPANFPTIRIAELAAFLSVHQHLFSTFIELSNPKQLVKKMKVKLSPYWHQHYLFDKDAVMKTTGLGKSSVENIVINTIVPLLACYAHEKGQEEYMMKALELLETIGAESNHITKIWESLEQPIVTAFDSQAAIGLYNDFCKKKLCLQCSIGIALLNS